MYNPTATMYNVQQAAGPQSAAVYDMSQQFSSRQTAGLQMRVLDVAASYFSSEPTNTATASAMQGQLHPQTDLKTIGNGVYKAIQQVAWLLWGNCRLYPSPPQTRGWTTTIRMRQVVWIKLMLHISQLLRRSFETFGAAS
ncbi:hypothetical protein V8F06_013422 [Rhypophila decipiens]